MPASTDIEARKRVLADLRAQGFLVAEKDYTLSIGKCERCGTVVEPRLSAQWFIKIKPLAEQREGGGGERRDHHCPGKLSRRFI